MERSMVIIVAEVVSFNLMSGIHILYKFLSLDLV